MTYGLLLHSKLANLHPSRFLPRSLCPSRRSRLWLFFLNGTSTITISTIVITLTVSFCIHLNRLFILGTFMVYLAMLPLCLVIFWINYIIWWSSWSSFSAVPFSMPLSSSLSAWTESLALPVSREWASPPSSVSCVLLRWCNTRLIVTSSVVINLTNCSYLTMLSCGSRRRITSFCNLNCHLYASESESASIDLGSELIPLVTRTGLTGLLSEDDFCCSFCGVWCCSFGGIKQSKCPIGNSKFRCNVLVLPSQFSLLTIYTGMSWFGLDCTM